MVFNSKEYAWVDLQIAFLGQIVGAARAVEYKVKQQTEALFAAGKQPRSIQKGKKEYEGNLTLLQSAVISLNNAAKAAGQQDATDIEFDLIISYAPENGLITVDKMQNISISELGFSIKEGDLYQEISLPFVALGMELNIA